MAQAPHLRLGDRVELSLDGRPTSWRLVGIVEEIGSPGAAYATDRALARAMGSGEGASLLRIALKEAAPAARAETIRAIEAAVASAGAPVEAMVPLAELRAAVDGHIAILWLRALLAMAVVMGIGRHLGLVSTTGTSVLERTREFGVMIAIGATPGQVARMVVFEALSVGGLSWALAAVLALPLTALLDGLIGNLGFLAPLPFAVAPAPIFLWFALVGAVSLLASLVPARRAGSLTVREALAHL